MAHSVKPMEMYAWAERLFEGPYLELFARSKPSSTADWTVWGNEIKSGVSLAPWGYPVPSDVVPQDTAGSAAASEDKRDVQC
jgi:hypothetical protein